MKANITAHEIYHILHYIYHQTKGHFEAVKGFEVEKEHPDMGSGYCVNFLYLRDKSEVLTSAWCPVDSNYKTKIRALKTKTFLDRLFGLSK